MGKIEDEKYTSQEDRDSQVRNIINQLNSERPSHEKSREVVMRADGTKAVRVVKKRKVMVSNDEKARRSRRSFVYSLLLILLGLGLLFGLFAYRMSKLASEDYFREAEAKLCQAYGAKSVRLSGARLDGLTLKVENLVVDFEGEGMVSHAEMSNLSGNLSTSSFFTGLMKFDELKVARISLTLREGVTTLDIPTWQGENLWEIGRVTCADFSCRVGEGAQAPFAVEHTAAYMYFPAKSRDSRVLIMNGGRLQLRGWKPMDLLEGRLQISPVALENLRVKATTEIMRDKGKEVNSYIEISGSLSQKEVLHRPLMADAHNMNFAEFSNNRFSHFFAAHTLLTATSKKQPSIRISLPFNTERPVFDGVFALKNVRFSSMPAVLGIIEHIEPTKRRPYLPPTIKRALVHLTPLADADVLRFTDEDMQELDLITMKGEINVGHDNSLSGNISYGIPALLTHVEYPDGVADPIFRDDGVLAWVDTTLSGTANAPADNIDDLERQADAKRAERPRRTPFENIDVDALSDKYLGSSHSVSAEETAAREAAEEAAGDASGTQAPATSPANNSGNPFLKRPSNPFDTTPSDPFGNDSSSDPFAPSASGDGGLTMPVDKSIFPGN